MLDIKYIRENKERVQEACRAKQVACDVERIVALDEEKREIQQKVESLRAKQNVISSPKLAAKVHKLDVAGAGSGSKPRIIEAKEAKEEIKKMEPELEKLEAELRELLLQLPNIPLEGVPLGDESHNQVLRQGGKIPSFDFESKDHLDLGEALDVIDVKRAAKVSGSRFGYLKGDLVLLEFALVQLAMAEAMKEKFLPVVPPVLIRQNITQGLGYWQGGGNEDYYLVYDPLEKREEGEYPGFYLAGTAEHALVPMHKDEIFQEKELPKRYVGFSTAFRREAGSYGKDTRGILRVHQFDKIELVSFTKPEDSAKEHELLLSIEERLWKKLEIPYQVVQLAAGDSSLPSASTIDIEAWMPGQDRYREVSSASNTTDFQARRLNTRFKNKEGKAEYVHMLNATAFAIGRTLIAIMENYQQKDGSVKIPKVLQKYVGKKEIKKQ